MESKRVKYFFVWNQKVLGPVTPTELRQELFQDKIHGSTLVWKTGQNGWQKLCKNAELVEFMGGHSMLELFEKRNRDGTCGTNLAKRFRIQMTHEKRETRSHAKNSPARVKQHAKQAHKNRMTVGTLDIRELAKQSQIFNRRDRRSTASLIPHNHHSRTVSAFTHTSKSFSKANKVANLVDLETRKALEDEIKRLKEAAAQAQKQSERQLSEIRMLRGHSAANQNLVSSGDGEAEMERRLPVSFDFEYLHEFIYLADSSILC